MKASDRSVLIGLLVLGLVAAFWFLMLAPKRERADELTAKADGLRAAVAEQEALAASALQAQADYSKNFKRLVVLGKAAPPGGDTPSFLTQLADLTQSTGTRFASLTLAGPEAIPTPATSETTTDQNAAAAATAAPATEAAAATLPLGATVGPAGLGVLPYTLAGSGNFFDVADLLAGLDSQVGTSGSRTKVGGRLLTISGFTLAPTTGGDLDLSLQVVSYVLPKSQGLTAGATPAGPPSSVPTAAAVSTPTPVAP